MIRLKNILVLVFGVLLVLVISCDEEVKQEKLPEIVLVDSLNINPNNIVYQYYEKFGFTDVCTHYRVLLKNDTEERSSWKKLPFKVGDLKKINQMSNKVDPISGEIYNPKFRKKDVFDDILLERKEFFAEDSLKSLNLLHGFYQVGESFFKIYDEKNKVLYVEIHVCN